jgi:Mn2+/Fe2+ NRAMP family transporter
LPILWITCGPNIATRLCRASGSTAFRLYLCWLTFPPLLFLFLGRPFQLVLAYGVLGSVFMPFLAVTLLLLLNSSRVPAEWRNGLVSNIGLVIAALLFLLVSGNELAGLFGIGD